MARAAGGATADETGGAHLVVVNETAATREISIRAWRDGAVLTDRLVVETGEGMEVPLPPGSEPLSVEVATDRGEHASLSATGTALVVVRDGSVLVTE